jgi:hypothetical protein
MINILYAFRDFLYSFLLHRVLFLSHKKSIYEQENQF